MRDVLYLGDLSLTGPAAYLAGVVHAAGWTLTHVPSQTAFDAALLAQPWRVCVISDYPASQMSPAAQQQLAERVAAGMGLLMAGGWASFHGLRGLWHQSALAACLPVRMADHDDRVQGSELALVHATQLAHPVLGGLPWAQGVPSVGGYNRVVARPDAQVLLELRRWRAHWQGEMPVLAAVDADPLLVLGQYGRGRTAALTTDLAPHWVGPLLDWGSQRVCLQADGANAVEVGDGYVRLLTQLLGWLRADGAIA